MNKDQITEHCRGKGATGLYNWISTIYVSNKEQSPINPIMKELILSLFVRKWQIKKQTIGLEQVLQEFLIFIIQHLKDNKFDLIYQQSSFFLHGNNEIQHIFYVDQIITKDNMDVIQNKQRNMMLNAPKVLFVYFLEHLKRLNIPKTIYIESSSHYHRYNTYDRAIMKEPENYIIMSYMTFVESIPKSDVNLFLFHLNEKLPISSINVTTDIYQQNITVADIPLIDLINPEKDFYELEQDHVYHFRDKAIILID